MLSVTMGFCWGMVIVLSVNVNWVASLCPLMGVLINSMKQLALIKLKLAIFVVPRKASTLYECAPTWTVMESVDVVLIIITLFLNFLNYNTFFDLESRM